MLRPVFDSIGGRDLHRVLFSTDGVGFPVPKDDTSINVTERKDWITAGPVKFPPMFGIGPGIEQNTHKIGECVDARELERAIAFMASMYLRMPGKAFRNWSIFRCASAFVIFMSRARP